MSNKFTFHVLGLQHTSTRPEFFHCAYSAKVWKFCKMMGERGHKIYHYGREDSNPPYAEHVPVLSLDDWSKTYGEHDHHKKFFTFDTSDHAYTTFNKNAIKEIGKRKGKNHFLLPFWGAGHKTICDAHPDMIVVEPGIGYAGGHFARFKIFESYSIHSAYYGLHSVGTCNEDWYDCVIQNYFDSNDFEYAPEEKEDYFLFLGRVYEGKGVNIAVQATEAIGAKLIIAGQNSLKEMGYAKTPDHVTELGYADVETRKRLMSRAKGAFIASLYNEPFGGVQVECLFSGTPTITTDWGSFTENNIHGLTGYRCRTFEHFTWAAKNIDRIHPQNCRDFAIKNFSLDVVAKKYEEYFQSVLNVHTGQGWYEPNPSRQNLDWLKKEYPNIPERMNYDNIESEEEPFAKRLADYIKNEINPTNVLDIGCGPGTYVYALRNLGVEAQGLDIDERVHGKEHLKYQSLFDITNESADTVICMEVAEHIPTEQENEVVAKIVGTVEKTLIWTAADVGQGGIGHINCKNKEKWAEKIEAAGLVRNIEKENALIEFARQGYHMGWFANNLLYFEKPNTKLE